MPKQLEKVYDPKQVEDRLYQFWMEKGYFHPKVQPSQNPYTIVIPPPNITGQLHMGHALDNTLQDILIRWRRMQGFNTLWIPGTDHASIATEAKIVEAMSKDGLSKEDVGRDEFLKRAWQWKDTYGRRIVSQLKRLGSSCDWDRERFTLDEQCSKAVREVFASLYEDGLIYRGERIINWCPHCLTSISDAEVEYAERDGSFWHIRYPVVGSPDEYLILATTRPETMLGDTAVAVHPDDSRYRHLVGKTLRLPLVNREIPVVADAYVEMDFGTGVVKITPAHDPNDFEVGLRHNLPVLNVFTPDAHINENGGQYAGLSREDCRKAIVADLDAQGYLVKTENHVHNVGSCYRCSTIVEPRVSLQWFVRMKPLAEPAINAVRQKETRFVPERFDKIYFHWMENIKDWCISRQLWWGHRIPAWYCGDCGQTIVARETPTSCPHCGSSRLEQDPDTLDTWFSSALWPFSTLGWPDKTPELNHFYPTSTLVTGYDIIFFWVARMIFSGLRCMGKSPFSTVFIHGLVRDAQGRKMSKSLGNGIDPLELIDQYGADALRLTLSTGNSPGNDMRFSTEKINAARNFANKIWNAGRFILMHLQGNETPDVLPDRLQIEDQWILSQYNTLIAQATDNLEKFELGLALQKVYDFIWDVYCDWYIELCKTRLQSDDQETAASARQVLVYVFSGCLKLLHPFMPFITEEIWQALPHVGESIMVSPWPKYHENLSFPVQEQDFQKVMDVIYAVRNRRGEMNVPPSRKAAVYLETNTPEVFRQGEAFIRRLAFADTVEIGESFRLPNAVRMVTPHATVMIPLDALIDKDKEIARLTKEKTAVEKDVAMLTGKLSNPGFLAKAPAAVVEGEKAKLAAAEERLQKLTESLSALGA